MMEQVIHVHQADCAPSHRSLITSHSFEMFWTSAVLLVVGLLYEKAFDWVEHQNLWWILQPSVARAILERYSVTGLA